MQSFALLLNRIAIVQGYLDFDATCGCTDQLCGRLQYPLAAAITGLAYLLGTLGYFFGCSTGAPDKRVTHGGLLRFTAQVILCGMCLTAAVQALR